jgi:hypothetical protein
LKQKRVQWQQAGARQSNMRMASYVTLFFVIPRLDYFS